MADTIRQSDLRNDNAAIMRRVARGESFVVTVNGHPAADLVPHQRDSPRRRFVPAHEMARAMADLPEVDAPGWARDIAAADTLSRSVSQPSAGRCSSPAPAPLSI